MTKAKYTNKRQKLEFFYWLANKYGYDLKTENMNNSRMLSDEYYQAKKTNIPKITIYRWLKNMNNNKTTLYNAIASNYINECLR